MRVVVIVRARVRMINEEITVRTMTEEMMVAGTMVTRCFLVVDCRSELVKDQGNCSYVRNCVLLLPCVERAWSIERLSEVVILHTFSIV